MSAPFPTKRPPPTARSAQDTTDIVTHNKEMLAKLGRLERAVLSFKLGGVLGVTGLGLDRFLETTLVEDPVRFNKAISEFTREGEEETK